MTYRLSIPDKIALGLGAGLAGTIVMTLGQRAEIAVSGREPSRSPAKAIEKVGHVELADRGDEERASVPIHFAYGTSLGVGLVVLERMREPWRTAVFFSAVWAAGAALLTGLGLAKPPHRQRPRDLAVDLGHHAVYATTAALAYRAANRFAEKRGLGRLRSLGASRASYLESRSKSEQQTTKSKSNDLTG